MDDSCHRGLLQPRYAGRWRAVGSRRSTLITDREQAGVGIPLRESTVATRSAPRRVYAVLDVETTGRALTSRIVEIACLIVAEDGSIIEEYESLIDPGRLVGATHVHGIDAAMLQGAPRFGDVASHVIGMLAGNTVVAHNLAYDWAILRGEFHRLGVGLPVSPKGICTAALVRATVGGSVPLGDACRRLGIDHDQPHTAAGDARATAAVLWSLRSHLGSLPQFAQVSRVDRLWRLHPPVAPVPRAFDRSTPSRQS